MLTLNWKKNIRKD